MQNSEELYKKLRKIRYGKEIRDDSLRRGREIQRLVNTLLKELADPLQQELEVKMGKYRYDGEIKIRRGKTILYEIYAGKLSRFRYDSLLNRTRNTYFPSKTYFLNIAPSFSKQDKARIEELLFKIAADRVKLCFMDYNTLISLHQFSSRIETEHPQKDQRKIKRLFLERLFKSDSIITEELFESALDFATERYFSDVQRSFARVMPGPSLSAVYERRLQNMEELLERILFEIRALRKELHKS